MNKGHGRDRERSSSTSPQGLVSISTHQLEPFRNAGRQKNDVRPTVKFAQNIVQQVGDDIFQRPWPAL